MSTSLVSSFSSSSTAVGHRNDFRHYRVSLTCAVELAQLISFHRTLYSMAKFAGLRDPVTLDFENSTIAYCVDAFTISIGALMGTSPVTAFIESATGISGKFSFEPPSTIVVNLAQREGKLESQL